MITIYAQARSGSSNLYRCLAPSFKTQKTEGEPFNPDEWKQHPEEIKKGFNKEAWKWRDDEFNHIFNKTKDMDLIKHIPDVCTFKQNSKILEGSSKTIFLYRKNQLERIASLWLSSSYKKTNGLDVWGKYSPQYSENFINENRPPITNSFIKKCFLDFDNFLEPIKKNKTPSMTVSYESLYNNPEKIKQICDFMSIELQQDSHDCFFSKDQKLTNLEQKYRLIPNLSDIEKIFKYDFPDWFLGMENND
jgi:hypothetical protein